jgi:hypothetical protein
MKMKPAILPLLLVSLCGACRPDDVGAEYVRTVTEEGVAAARAHLREVPASAPARVDEEDAKMIRRSRSAEKTFRDARIVELAPCSATLDFEYEHDGAPQRGSAQLECEPGTGAWKVDQMYMMRSH